MKVFNILSLFLFFLVLSSFAYAVQPPITTISSAGYELVAPHLNYLLYNTTTKFHIHLFNASNGMPIISGATCYMHMYNRTNAHILKMEQSTVTDQFDYEFAIDGNNFTKYDAYDFIFQCNSSALFLGGYLAEQLSVVNQSYIEAINKIPDYESVTNESTKRSMWFLIFMFVLLYGLLIMGFVTQDINLSMIASFGIILAGLYIVLNGIAGMTNQYSSALALINICIGAYILVRLGIEQIGFMGGD